jgi:PAS domain S-box-containing protein
VLKPGGYNGNRLRVERTATPVTRLDEKSLEEKNGWGHKGPDFAGDICGTRAVRGQKTVPEDAARSQTEEALRASEERYRILVESQSEMLCRFRPDGEILFVNGAYARALGTTADALTGRNFWSYIPEAERAAVKAMLEQLTPDKPEIRIENRFETAEGERWTLWTNRGLKFDANGRLLEAQSSGIDITGRKQMEQALKESDRRKDEFLATLAHELRNPLAPIANALEILKQAGDNPGLQRQAREAIERQLSHLVRLVDDLLDVSRITRDKLELRKTRVNLISTVRHALETCGPLAQGGELSIEVNLPGEPIWLDADPVRLAQVFNNLLNNAYKYTGKGGTIRLKAEQRGGGDVTVSIRDSGIGIPADKLEAVFVMFEQVEETSPQATGGLGIGLTLVKRLVELHGGTIRASSEGMGHGSEFVVRLPILAAVPEEEQPNAPEAASKILARRILVVDDNRDSADSLALLLGLHGHETQAVYDGMAAVETAESFRPHMLLLDRGLPKLNGIEACRRIREQPWGKEMVIVALTGWGQEEDRRKSTEAGFDEHLVKPVDNSTLLQLLARFLS